MVLSLGGGGAIALGSQESAGALVVEARARIIDTAGPLLSYRWSPRFGGHLFLGAEIRPLWPALFLLDLSTHNEWFDLFLQSIGLEIGAVFLPLGQPQKTDLERHVAFGVGVAASLPLLLPTRTSGSLRGVFLRLSARHINSSSRFRKLPIRDSTREWMVFATLEISFGINVGDGV